jgi:site-specific DNA-methyltransferase (adenine-specific)
MRTQLNKIYNMDCLEGLKQLPSESIDCVVTSPPYWALRDYGTNGMIWGADSECKHNWQPSGFCSKCGAWKGQLGLEPTFELYIKHLSDIFDEVKRVLKKTGTCWVNLGDTYYTKSGSGFLNDNLSSNTSVKAKGINKANRLRGKGLLPSKCLCLIPFRFVIEMVKHGWILRNVIIWHKPNCMPSSTKDRCSVDFEYLFFFVKDKKYWFKQQFEPLQEISVKRAEYGWHGKKLLDGESYNGIAHTQKMGKRFAPLEGRNKRCIWKIPTQPFKGMHFATFPEALIETPIKAGCPEFICKKCGKAREKIYEYKCGTIGKGWHDHSNDLEKGMRGRGGIPQTDIPYEVIDKGYSDCGCNAGWGTGIVLDPFMGSGTTAVVSKKLGRSFVGFEINLEYVEICNKRLKSRK